MAYPEDPLPVVIEFWDGSQWVDITAHTFARRGGGIEIERGFPDEGREPEPSRATLTLDNRDGRFSPRNPGGPYYGKIGRNTPVRVRIVGDISGDGYLHIEDENHLGPLSRVRNLPAGSINVTEDLDVRVDVLSFGWKTGSSLAAMYPSFDGDKSWALLVTTDGLLRLIWTTDGTDSGSVIAESTVAAPLVDGQRKAVRATLDVDNGSSGWTVTFYTADTIDGPWTQLGSPVTGSGVTSIFPANWFVEIGHDTTFFGSYPEMRIYAVQVLDGIDGDPLADLDFRGQTQQDPARKNFQVQDDAGTWWEISSGPAQRMWLVQPGIRMVGEVSEWPTRWDVSGQNVETAITAQGVLRRWRQGGSLVRTPMRSVMQAYDPTYGLMAYWPMEEGSQATSFASGLREGGSPLKYHGERPDSGENGIGPLLGSDRIPVLNAKTTLRGAIRKIPSWPVTDFSLGCIMDVPPTTGWADNTPIIWVEQPGSVAIWEIRYKSGSGGDLQVRALDASGAELAASSTLDVNIDGERFWLYFEVVQSGSNIAWAVETWMVDDDGVSASIRTLRNGTFSNLTLNPPTGVVVAPYGGLNELAIGHIAVLGQDSLGRLGGHPGDVGQAMISFAGETAAVRAHRLATEAGVNLRIRGTVLDMLLKGDTKTVAMGPQAIPSTVVDAFNETWAADQALVFETRDQLGLTFRIRQSLYSQPVAVTLDYTAGGEVAPDLEPIDDDQRVRNDIEVRRKNGSSFRAVDSTTRMGVQDPPNGVGRYEEQVEVNLYSDDQLEQHAYWRLHLGTWDEARFPRVTINMAALAAAGKTDLIANICALDVGDRIQIINLPIWAGTIDGVADLLVLGYSEQIGHPTEWTITLNCVPAGPYLIARYAASTATVADNPSRYQISGCTTRAAFDTTTDSVLQVNTPKGEFTSDPTFLPFMIESAGVVMEVSAVSGSGAAQDLTVTVLNGVSKTIPTGSTVLLLHRAARYGL